MSESTTADPSAPTTPSPDADPAVAVCDSVARTYGRGRTAVVAVHSLTCRLTRRTRLAIVGRSGSGKSTVLHVLAGLAEPTAGRVSWPVLGGHPRSRPGQVGVIFQGPSLLPALTVRENVAFPLLLAGHPAPDAERAADRALHHLVLVGLADALPQDLSGGQAQRVAAARVLAGEPALILADEPTAHLDRGAGLELIEALAVAADDLHAALVVATHDIAIADRLPQRWTMSDGQARSRDPGVPGRFGP